jgi:hypothetical protein
LTNSNTSLITFQVVSGSVKVRATTGAAPSTLATPGYVYHAHPADRQTENGELRVPITDFTVTAGANRVFATPLNGRKAIVVVDHA